MPEMNVCVHEAGHCIAAFESHYKIEDVDGSRLKFFLPDSLPLADRPGYSYFPENNIKYLPLIAVAGWVAEDVSNTQTHWSNDNLYLFNSVDDRIARIYRAKGDILNLCSLIGRREEGNEVFYALTKGGYQTEKIKEIITEINVFYVEAYGLFFSTNKQRI